MLKVATIVLLVMLVFAGVYSFIAIFVPKVTMSSGFEASTGKSFDGIQDGKFGDFLTGTYTYMGIFALATTISGFFIVFAGFRKAEKWAWFAMMVIGGLVWIYGTINSLSIGDTLNGIMQIVGLGLLVIGLLLPLKEFFAG